MLYCDWSSDVCSSDLPLNTNTPICEKILFVLLAPDSGFTETVKIETVVANEVITGLFKYLFLFFL